ncbi:MAG TPA: ATP cone domain-containing protein, partial [Spirochaetia bacterium]|nr:ATP cone domain-containing protein [Spirochaetia bacterium]
MSEQTITLEPVTIRNNRPDDVQTVVPVRITKRDGRIVDFEPALIQRAVERCFAAVRPQPSVTPAEITNQVVNVVSAQYPNPSVENIQDVVELVLQANGEYSAAKAYILYRAEHARLRQDRAVPAEVKQAFA